MSFLDRLRLRFAHCCAKPPGQVVGVTATTGGGSGEVQVTWDPLDPSEAVRYYRVYEQKGTGTRWHLADVTEDALGLLEPGRIGIVDAPDYWPWPTIGLGGSRCYEITAVGRNGLEGPPSTATCRATP